MCCCGVFSLQSCQQTIMIVSDGFTGLLLPGWWWCQVGRAKFELVDYAGAAEAFAKARKVDPCRLQVQFLHLLLAAAPPRAQLHLHIH